MPVNQYLIKYKPFLLFLGKFLLTYIVLTLAYQWYLSQFSKTDFEVDSFTQSVARQTQAAIGLFDSRVASMPHLEQASIKLYYRDQFVARIVEGCNALSVIILFIAFVIAFTGRFKTTTLFILSGSALIHVLNIFRIAVLVVALYHFPEYEALLHGVIFPLFIYGVVFLLWVVWVNKFSLYAAKPVEQ